MRRPQLRATACSKAFSLWSKDQILPFVRQFYGCPSREDDLGNVHEVAQGEGGEQGDPLMPALFSLGSHPALAAV